MAWRHICSDEMLVRVDAVLAVLCDKFCFNPDDRYQIGSDDCIMDIYRAVYPLPHHRWFTADSMELEVLMTAFKDQFGIEGTDVLELPLGEVVEMVGANASKEL